MVEVIDGDTVMMEFRDGWENKIRLLDVDTPENYGEVEPGEQRASIVEVMCKSRVKGRKITLPPACFIKNFN